MAGPDDLVYRAEVDDQTAAFFDRFDRRIDEQAALFGVLVDSTRLILLRFRPTIPICSCYVIAHLDRNRE